MLCIFAFGHVCIYKYIFLFFVCVCLWAGGGRADFLCCGRNRQLFAGFSPVCWFAGGEGERRQRTEKTDRTSEKMTQNAEETKY